METKVKEHTRLVNGKLQRVKQYDRDIERKNPASNRKPTEVDRKVLDAIQQNKELIGYPLLAAVTLTGLSAATIAAVKLKHANNIQRAANNIVKNPDIKDYRYLSKINDAKLPDNLDQYEGVLIVTGGFGRQGGNHALQIGEYAKKQYPNHYVITVNNEAFDLGYRQSDNPIRELNSLYNTLVSASWNGNKTSEDLARVAYNVRNNTDKPITFFTASGGGMAAKEAMEISDKIGIKDIKGLGMGSPTFALSRPKSEFKSVIDKKDAITGKTPVDKKDAYYINRSTEPLLIKDNPYQGKIPTNQHHEFHSYLLDPNSRSVIDNIIYRTNTRKPSDYDVDLANNIVRYKKRNKITNTNFSFANNYDDELNILASFKQEVKVKQYIREGKIVRSYSRTDDRRKENPTPTITKDNVVKAASVGAIGLVGGAVVVTGIGAGTLALARKTWKNNLPKRARLIEDQARDLESGKLIDKNSGQRLDSLIKNADTVIFTKGGINMNSKGGTIMKKDILEYAKNNNKKWAVIDLDNIELDSTGIKEDKFNLNQTLKDWWENFIINPFSKGYNNDSIQLAAYARATELIGPDKKKVIMGYSAGGVASIAATSDLSTLKNVSKTSVVTVGAPYSGITKIEDKRVIDTVSFFNDDDIVANSVLSQGNKQNINPIYLSRRNKRKGNILDGHLWTEYIEASNGKIFEAIDRGSDIIRDYK